jgi:hypothetical protein
MLPPLDHPCLGYVCGVPDGTIPGLTAWDCTGMGYSGARAGCVDPICTGWRPSIPYCGASVWRQLETQDPQVPQSLPYEPDPLTLFTAMTGKGGGCCCGGSGASGGPAAGLGPETAPDAAPGTQGYDSGCGCTGTVSFLGLPWWVWVLILILAVKHGR